jgi:hypothetical protein
MDSFIATVEEDKESGDFFIQLPPEFCKAQDWRPGDRLDYTVEASGQVMVKNLDQAKRKKKGEMPLFIVEQLVNHRVRHAIRAKTAEHAMELVALGESEEFDQNHVGSNVLSARQVGMQEYLDSFELPSDPELKKLFIRVVDYKE